jgi:hypothetical protein
VDEHDHRMWAWTGWQVQISSLRARGTVAVGTTAIEEVEDQTCSCHLRAIVTDL